MENSELRPCKNNPNGDMGYEAVAHNETVVFHGYWIRWCRTHEQPEPWCEQDIQKKRLAEAEGLVENLSFLLSAKTGVSINSIDLPPNETWTHLMNADVDQIVEVLAKASEFLKGAEGK